MTKKIIILSHGDISFNGGSIGMRVGPIIKKLKKENYEVHIFTRSCDEKLKKEYNIYSLPKSVVLLNKSLTYINMKVDSPKINHMKNYILNKFYLSKIKKLNLEEFSIIHSWDYFEPIYKYVKKKNKDIKIFQDVPIAYSTILKGIKDKEELWPNKKFVVSNYIKNCFKYIDYYIAPSEFVKDSLTKEKRKEDKIKIIPFGVDSKVFKPKNKKSKTFSVSFIGNINNRKGVSYLVKAWKELKLENAELNLYGRVYPEVKEILNDSKKYNINTPGYVEARKVLPNNTIYILPSLLEGSSKSIYEAMASGLPVIATYNSGPVFENGKEGFIIPIQDIKAIKNKISYFYKNPKEVQKFSKNARKLAEKYSWETYANKVFKEYRKV